ncbi:GNAT family N-acetyltransferase [Nitrosomonas sp. Nm84]|uniref:GNAT family N-acetyltransferase n=1 Tax=Nitrosomonas sp. Nm84 TaxID=200124 RepID=UPI0021AC0085|nr:GNAT family N-acetyltransferase [Nitrosomonas sp. Nm84]
MQTGHIDESFQHDKTNPQATQQFLTNLLITRLPAPPCRVLQIDTGSSNMTALLSQHGYDIRSLNPDAQQITGLQDLPDSKASSRRRSLENCDAPPASFNAVVLLESAQYIEPLVLFNKSLDLLPLSGDLIIVDEFALKHDQADIRVLYLLSSIVALAERLGFELIEHMDLSSMTTNTPDYRSHGITVHQQHVIKDIALTVEQATRLDASNQANHPKNRNEHYSCYALLHFRKKTLPKWRLQALTKQQLPEMLGLFKKTFNHDMTPATWQWKYDSNLGRGIGVWRNNQLIAHYGGIPRKILFFGQPQTAVQIGDVMVDSNERGILTKKGPFFLMTATFLERYIGYGKAYLLGFGFPNDRHMKVAELLKLYAEVGRMVEFSWKIRSRFPLWRTRLHLIDQARAAFAATAVNACWQRMAADLHTAIVGIRDWQYLQRRYLDHPTQHYQVILVKNRFSARARGVMVLRYDPEGCEIVDVIAPLAEIPLLITHARRLAGAHGAARVFCRITENFADYFAVAGGTRQPVNIRIPTNIWSDGPAPETLKDHWWLMSGDMDFR